MKTCEKVTCDITMTSASGLRLGLGYETRFGAAKGRDTGESGESRVEVVVV